ncbi:MAG: hypothetical protein GEV08_16045, partial [Acidimicrobiia bacterium]|nr:hypothetical protein [Acidimicrobiia bacterium]
MSAAIGPSGRVRAGDAVLAAAAEEGERPPTVVVVGCGDGDPDLLTVRALEVLRGAGLIVSPPALFALASAVAGPGTSVLGQPPARWPRDGHAAWLVAGSGGDA